MRATLTALALTLALVAACSGDGGEPDAATEVDAVQAGLNRILVLSNEGDVFTIDPDGEGRVDLTSDAEAALQHRQPVWSPTGERIAWATIDARGGTPQATVVTSRPDGGDRTSAPTAALPIFLYWDPTGSRVAYLAPTMGDLELGVVEVAAAGREATPLASGAPFYFSWRPDGGALLSHIGADELSYLTLDGASTRIAEAAAAFPAPEWSSATGAAVYAARTAEGQMLVLAEPPGGTRRELLRFEGLIRFALNAGGDRLAYAVISLPGGESGDDDERAVIALRTTQQQPEQALPGLAVFDLTSGRSRQVSGGNVVAFFWSPDGDSLLYLLAEPGGGLPWLRWYVWDGDRSVRLSRFLPSPTFAQEYLPFFDQFARALSPWSPDGERFVYAGTDPRGEAGIWVQSADGAVPPIHVAEGAFASWSPR